MRKLKDWVADNLHFEDFNSDYWAGFRCGIFLAVYVVFTIKWVFG